MAMLIWVLAMVWLVYNARRAMLADRPRRNPVLDNFVAAVDTYRDSPAETLEGQLSQELVGGRIDSETYRRRMTQLTQPDDSQKGQRRNVADDGHDGTRVESPR